MEEGRTKCEVTLSF